MAVDESLVTSSDGQILSNSVSVKANGEDVAGEASCDYTYKKPYLQKRKIQNLVYQMAIRLVLKLL